MASQLVALWFDANDPVRLERFWAEALGPQPGIDIRFLPVAETKRGKNRIHLDLTTESEHEQADTVGRLLALGASHVDVGQRGDEGHVVLADPEGNELCIIEPGNRFLATCGRLGSVTCDGSPETGYFWSELLGWPLVWDQDEETAIRAPDGTGPFITWGPPVPPADMKSRLRLEIAVPGDSSDRTVRTDPDGTEFYVRNTS